MDCCTGIIGIETLGTISFKMSLWVDKHRPNSLAKLDIHNEITNKLLALSKSEELPHLLFYGPPGAGKKTRVKAMLREIYGAGADRVKLVWDSQSPILVICFLSFYFQEHRSFKNPSNRIVEITTLGSNYHIECNPSDAGNQDRFVIQEVIKEIASHSTLQSGSAGSRSFKIGMTLATFWCRQTINRFVIFLVVMLTEVDKLSKQAQAGLRRTMEKYVICIVMTVFAFVIFSFSFD